MTAHADPLKAAIELMETESLMMIQPKEAQVAQTLALIAIAQSLRELQATFERSTLVPRVLKNPMMGLR
jgi:hypothetical protein